MKIELNEKEKNILIFKLKENIEEINNLINESSQIDKEGLKEEVLLLEEILKKLS